LNIFNNLQSTKRQKNSAIHTIIVVKRRRTTYGVVELR